MIWRVLVFTMMMTSVVQAAAPYATIQLRRDTPANWSSINPVLKNGEPGCEMTGLPLQCTAQKIGDGVTRWSSLPYIWGGTAGVKYGEAPWVDVRTFGAKCDDVTDDTAALQSVFTSAPVDTTILIPGTCVTSGNTITKRLFLVGVGSGRWWGVNGGRLRAKNATQEYILKIGNVANSLIIGGSVNNIVFYGADHTFTDAMVVGEAGSSWHFNDCGWHNGVGRALRLKNWFEGTFDKYFFRMNDASAAESVIFIDQIYNGISNNNVNNLSFLAGHMEGNKGVYVSAHNDSNLDVLRIHNTKFEQGLGAVTGGPWSLFDFGSQANRVSITGNHFTNFKAAYKYDTLLKQSGGSVTFTGNDISVTDASTYFAKLSGAVSATIRSNTLMVFDGSLPLFSNTSTRAQDIEFPKYSQNITYPIDQNSVRIFDKALGSGMISIHKLSYNNQNFITDTDVQNLEQTAYRESTISTLVQLPMQAFKDYPSDVRISLRCKSPAGTGKVGLQVGTTVLSVITPSTTYDSVCSWVVPAALFAGLGNSGSDRLKVFVDGASVGPIHVDGVFIAPLNTVNGVMTADTLGAKSVFSKVLRVANGATGTFDLRMGTNNTVNGRGMVLVSANWTGGAFAMVYLDGTALQPAFVSANVAAATVNPDTAGKLNLYFSSTGVMGIKNRLGSDGDISLTYFPSTN